MKQRIRDENDFQALYRRGRRITTPAILVYILPSPTRVLQYAIVVPNAVIPLAVKRNLVRRRIRDILERNSKEIIGKQILISVKKDISRIPFSELVNELSFVFAVRS